MILSGKEIEENIGTGIIIKPFQMERINPNSYNLSLHNELLIYDEFPLDMKKANHTKKIIIHESGFLMEPGKLYRYTAQSALSGF